MNQSDGRSGPVFESLESRQLLSVVVANPVGELALNVGAGSNTVSLANLFRETDSEGTIVRFFTSLGIFDVGLYDVRTPQTVTNFLKYINDGDYLNTFIHRSDPDFVIQGGGYSLPSLEHIPVDAPVVNEPGVSNTRGTIAMARVGGQVNSATSEWFINLGNNTGLDSVDQGFTAFGKVLGNGMNLVDDIAEVPVYDFGVNPYRELPLRNYDPNGDLTWGNFIQTYLQVMPLTSSNPAEMTYLSLYLTGNSNSQIVKAKLVGNQLELTPARNKSGVSTITIRAVNPSGQLTEYSFDVVVGGNQFGNVDGQKNVKLYAVDADGTQVTFALSGAGVGTLVDNGGDWTVELAGTDAKSSLTVATRNSGAVGDDGRVTLVGITADASLKAVKAKTTDLAGDLELNGHAIGSVLLGDLTGNLNIGDADLANRLTSVSIALGRVADAAITSGMEIKQLKLIEWLDTDATADRVQTPALSKLTVSGDRRNAVAGDFWADLAIGVDGQLPAKPTLGGVSVAGDLIESLWDVFGHIGGIKIKLGAADSTLRATGNIGAVSMASADHISILAGMNEAVETRPANNTLFENVQATIKSVRVSGLRGEDRYFTDSYISAARIGSVSLVNVEFADDLVRSGIYALQLANGGEIKSVSVKDTVARTSYRYSSKTGGDPGIPGLDIELF